MRVAAPLRPTTPVVPASAAAEPTVPVPGSRRRWVLLAVAVGLLALVMRFQMEVRGGGLLGINAYDDGVHLSAASAMLHGRVPYRDFLFLQAPGMLIAASPFALVARLLGDPAGLASFRVAFECIGALNAVAVVAVLRRFGWNAALAGGVFYAVFAPAVYDERTALLEPIGTLAVLTALALLPRARGGDRRAFVAVGVALGVACDFKIWYVITAVVILAFARGGRLRVLIGLGIAGALAYLPFFALAPRQMFEQVVLDQLGRPRNDGATLQVRLRSLTGVAGIHAKTPFDGVAPDLLVGVLVVLILAALVLAVLDPRCRVIAALFAADTVIVLSSPSYFAHYVSLIAPLLALLLGISVAWTAARLRRRGVRAALVAVVLLAVGLLNVQHDLDRVDVRAPGAQLRAAAEQIRGCVVADDPTILLVMNVLTRDLDHGCPLRPDVSGYSYGPDATRVDGKPVARNHNPKYQAGLLAYLQSGAAFIQVRHDTIVSTTTQAELNENPVLFRAGRYVIRGTR